jgi:hypothetical protein
LEGVVASWRRRRESGWWFLQITAIALQKLEKQGIKDPYMLKVKAVYLHTFCKTQGLFYKTVDVLRALEQAGIKTILLKGAALAMLYYKHAALRPMHDLDVLVPTNKAGQAIEVLQNLGWQPLVKAPHSQAFLSTTDAVEIDLHWHALLELSEKDSDEDFWNDAVPFEINNFQGLTLSPTDLLFHVCIHGLKWEATPTFRWIADAMMILRSGRTIDWDRLLQLAKKHRMTLPLKESLMYLKNLLNAPVPADVLERLESAHVTIAERFDYSSRICVHSERGPFLTLWAYYREYQHWARSHATSDSIIGFPAFLKQLWGVNNIWQVPYLAVKGFLSRSFNSVKRQLKSS